MLVDIYSIRSGSKIETVDRDLAPFDLSNPARRLQQIAAAAAERHGRAPGGLLAVPRLGRLQLEGLATIADASTDWTYCPSVGNRAMQRLVVMGLAKWRLSGGGASGGHC
jgi:hypothetical protein